MRNLWIRAAPLAAAVALAGCTKVGTSSGAGGRHPYTVPHVLRYAVGTDIQLLNPLTSATIYEMYLASMCMAYLIKTDANGYPTVPELITEIPSQKNGGVSADGKTITWHLRHNVKWSDGVPFTADLTDPEANAAAVDAALASSAATFSALPSISDIFLFSDTGK